MAYEDIQILVEGFRWFESTAEEEHNFFSSSISMFLHSKVDMKSVLILNELKIKKIFENIEKENGKFTLFHNTEEIKFQFIDYEHVEGNPHTVGTKSVASDIFRCFEDTQRCKWLIKIMHKKLPVWYGVVKPENIDYQHGDMTVNVSAYGIEAEFGEYYQNKTLVETISHTINNGNAAYRYYDGTPPTRDESIIYYPLQTVMSDNFPSSRYIDFTINTNSVGTWFVNQFPLFFLKNTFVRGILYDFVLIKGGYKKLVEEGVSKLGWLSKTCNAMGWQFFFQFIGSTLILFVVPRSRNNLTYIQHLDYEEINPNWVCGKRGVKEKFNYIEIPCGGLTGGDNAFFESDDTNPNDLKGNHVTILSDKVGFVNKSIHFDSVYGSPNASEGYAFLKYNGEDDNNYKAVAWTSDTPDYKTSTPTYYEISKSDVLRIDSGLNNNKYIKIAGFGVHFDMEDGFGFDDNDLIVKGCYGDLLFKLPDPGTFYTYQDYVLSEEFRLNFVPYLAQNKELEVNFSINETHSNPYTTLRIDGAMQEGAQVFNGKYFATSEIETDYLNDVTTYSVFETTI